MGRSYQTLDVLPMSTEQEPLKVGDVVEITRPPIGCCGLIKQGWFGTVVSIIDLENNQTGEDDAIVILEDNTLAWERECRIKHVGGRS